MAYLSRILIYPVKSLDMVSVDTAVVLPGGPLADDRRFAIIDGHGHYVNGKKNVRVHLLRSCFNPQTQELTIAGDVGHDPRTFHVDAERHKLEQWLSNFFGLPVSFRENIDAGFPDDKDSPGPTIISTATLQTVAGWFGFTLEQARARFRANLEIDGVPPFWEDQLFGLRGTTVRFKIGSVIFDGVNPCQRCIVPARDQSTGTNIPDFAKRFVEMRKKHFPEWAESSRFNHFYRLAINTRLVEGQSDRQLTVGDEVTIIGEFGEPEPIASVPTALPRPIRWSGSLVVARVEDNTPSVRTFRLSATDNGALPFTYLPGQFLNLELNIDGILHRRCYTIASSPTRTGHCEITVKREEGGTVSRYLHTQVENGTKISVSGPGGRFTFAEEDADAILLIGAGVGITPLMSKIRYLTDRNWPGTIKLLYSVQSEKDIIFRKELEALQSEFPNLDVLITLTREPSEKWIGPRGRITPAMLRQMLPSEANRRIDICGPVEMADQVTRMLLAIGVAADQIKSEAFGGSTVSPQLGYQQSTSPTIGMATFADSGKSETLHEGQTILEVASQIGIAIDRGCLEGICGRCKVRLLAGEVTMEVDEALSAGEKKLGYVLACQAKPTGSVLIDL
jgi:ferredoxin-NADP reductase/uncharacterized protein YcbX